MIFTEIQVHEIQRLSQYLWAKCCSPSPLSKPIVAAQCPDSPQSCIRHPGLVADYNPCPTQSPRLIPTYTSSHIWYQPSSQYLEKNSAINSKWHIILLNIFISLWINIKGMVFFIIWSSALQNSSIIIFHFLYVCISKGFTDLLMIIFCF